MASSTTENKYNNSPPNLRNLFQSLKRAPVPFFRFGKSQGPPTLNTGISTLIAASINSRKLVDSSSYHQFFTSIQAFEFGIQVEFPSLENLVELISDSLLQGRKATSELEAIYIQNKGCTLTTHQNSLTRNGHIAVLYVVATGDWNADSEGNFIVKRPEEMYRGEACGPGAYAACYPSELMILNTANSSEESFRVTIIYSIFIPEPFGESSGTSDRTCDLTWISQPQSKLSQLNPDIGKNIVSFLRVTDMRNLAFSCKQFSGITQVEDIITKAMMECREELLLCKSTNDGTDAYDLSIPLQWSYFTYHDQYNNHCEECWLFGLDYVVYRAVQKAFPDWGTKCRKTVMRCVNRRIDNENLQIVQAATGWELNYEDISHPLDLVFPSGKNWTSETWDAVLYLSDYFQSDYDDEWEAFVLWPFFFTRFVIGKTYFRGMISRLVPYSTMEVENEQYVASLYRSSCVILQTKKNAEIPDRGLKNDELCVVPVWIED